MASVHARVNTIVVLVSVFSALLRTVLIYTICVPYGCARACIRGRLKVDRCMLQVMQSRASRVSEPCVCKNTMNNCEQFKSFCHHPNFIDFMQEKCSETCPE